MQKQSFLSYIKDWHDCQSAKLTAPRLLYLFLFAANCPVNSSHLYSAFF